MQLSKVSLWTCVCDAHAAECDGSCACMQTTPPCAETLLWHVFISPGTITAADQIALEQMVAQTFDKNPFVRNDYRHNNRPVQPRNSRTVFFAL